MNERRYPALEALVGMSLAELREQAELDALSVEVSEEPAATPEPAGEIALPRALDVLTLARSGGLAGTPLIRPPQSTLVRSGKPPATKAKGEKAIAQRLQQTRGLEPRKKFQALIERTVQTLLMTATAQGDLTFRADIDANVMSDLSLDVTLEGRELVISFYTNDIATRRLLEGYERLLTSHLGERGLRVKEVRFLSEPDPAEAPAVPIHRPKG